MRRLRQNEEENRRLKESSPLWAFDISAQNDVAEKTAAGPCRIAIGNCGSG